MRHETTLADAIAGSQCHYDGVDHTSYFSQSRSELWPLIPTSARRFLDIGCAGGALGQAIKQRQSAWYCGVEIDSRAASIAKDVIDEVHVGDALTMPIPYGGSSFDVLVFADILEHLPDPLPVLRRWLPVLDNDGLVIVSLPNVRHFTVTLPLFLQGRWEYEDRGILDRTHLRFFTRRSARRLMIDADLKIEIERPHMRYIKRIIQLFDYCTFHVLKEHMVQQWMYVARKETGADRVFSPTADATGSNKDQ